MAVEHIVELVSHKTIYPEIFMQLKFIKENCQRLMAVTTALEEKHQPLAPTVFNLVEDLRLYLGSGAGRSSFVSETDQCLSKLPQSEKKKHIKALQGIFQLSEKKLVDHLDRHSAYEFNKAARIFDPRQLQSLGHDIGDYAAVKPLAGPSPQLLEEWLIYTQWRDAIPTPFNLPNFWNSLQDRFPVLASIATDATWMPVTSVDVERSFSQYKHLLNDRRESLTEDNTKRLLMLYFNGDIEGRFS